jgi:YHS domain-containing protein
MKKFALLAVMLVAVLMVAGVVMAKEPMMTTETKAVAAVEQAAPVVPAVVTEKVAPVVVGNMICPVEGAKIEKMGENTVEFEGKVYNVCCAACKEEFAKDPKKYIVKVDEELAAKAKEAVPQI